MRTIGRVNAMCVRKENEREGLSWSPSLSQRSSPSQSQRQRRLMNGVCFEQVRPVLPTPTLNRTPRRLPLPPRTV